MLVASRLILGEDLYALRDALPGRGRVSTPGHVPEHPRPTRREIVDARRSASAGSEPSLTIAIPLGVVEGLTVTAPLPELLSQTNVEQVTGIPARVYLEALRAPGFPLHVGHLGKLRLVDRRAFVGWLLAERKREGEPANDGDEVSQEADRILDEIGVDYRPPARRASRRR